MRAVLTGTLVSFRYAELKSGKVGQFDLIQFGSDRHPTKIVQLYVPSAPYVRLLLNNMKDGLQPIVSFLVWMTFNKDVEIEVLELLSITNPGGLKNGTGSVSESDSFPDRVTSADTDTDRDCTSA